MKKERGPVARSNRKQTKRMEILRDSGAIKVAAAQSAALRRYPHSPFATHRLLSPSMFGLQRSKCSAEKICFLSNARKISPLSASLSAMKWGRGLGVRWCSGFRGRSSGHGFYKTRSKFDVPVPPKALCILPSAFPPKCPPLPTLATGDRPPASQKLGSRRRSDSRNLLSLEASRALSRLVAVGGEANVSKPERN
jgi:hypothetical protein